MIHSTILRIAPTLLFIGLLVEIQPVRALISNRAYNSGICRSLQSPFTVRSMGPLFAEPSKSGRKRRIKGSKKVSQADSAEDNDVEVDDSRAEPSASTMSSAVLDFTEVGVKESKLPPLAGTTAEKMAKYGEKSGIERNLEEIFAPTPAGKEPKAIQIMKTVTWGAVLLLVLLEIVVSIKVGGSPFDFSRATLGGNNGDASMTTTDDAEKKGGLGTMMTPEQREKVFGYNFEE